MKALLLAALSLTACIRLDPFLFQPVAAAPGDDLLVDATAVPVDLRRALTLPAQDGTPVDAGLLAHRPDDGTPPSRHNAAILYCHGNAYNLAHYVPRAEALWRLGYTVLLFDYRGFGKTPGKPSERGILIDAQAARAYLETLLPRRRVALYGYSLGGAVAAQLADAAPPPVLILESTFASVSELIDDNQALEVPSPWYADARLATRDTIARFPGELLLWHGLADTYVKSKYSEEIAANALKAAHKRLILVPGAGHGTVPCNDKRQDQQVDGHCPGGFAADYLETVAQTIDHAVQPDDTIR